MKQYGLNLRPKRKVTKRATSERLHVFSKALGPVVQKLINANPRLKNSISLVKNGFKGYMLFQAKDKKNV